MATNEQMRRASGTAMEQARRQSGINMEQSRRAAGAAMIAERTGSSIVEDLNALAPPPAQRKTLPPIGTVGGVPPKRGRAVWTPPATSSGGGIASPLTEMTVTPGGAPNREYWPAGLTSSDGLFVLPAIKTLNLLDANGAEVKIELANPQSTT